MKSFLRTAINQLGFEIVRKHPIERRAKEIFQKYTDYTMISESMYVENLKLIWDFSSVKGCVIECGVWRGGMSAGIASLLPDREFFLFDSFEGLPEAKSIDGERAIAWQQDTESPGYYENCTAEVGFATKAMVSTGATHHIIKGWFKDTLHTITPAEEIAVLRLDADWYESTMECLSILFPKVKQGGLIIFDDYFTWDGCSRAVHDYLSKISSTSRIHKTPLGVAYIVKSD